MRRSELGGLREKIAALAAEGRAIRAKIGPAKGRARYDLWSDKRSVGSGARDLLVAYAFLRGVPYRVVEPTARATPYENTDQARERWAHWLSSVTGVETEAALVAWLAVPEAAERATARAAARQAWFIRRDARRQADAARRRGAV